MRGAPKGNTNAFKHGLYARVFSTLEVKDLRAMPNDDLRQEIALVRVAIARILKLADGQQDLETAAKALNALTNAVSILNTTIRTHALLSGAASPFDEAMLAALQDEPFYISGGDPASKEPKWTQPSLLTS